MNPFKAGQQVLCISDKRLFVDAGKTYTVVRTEGDNQIVVFDNDGDEGVYATDMFQALITPAPARSHGIKVGSKVLVLNCEGSISFRGYVNTIQTVDSIRITSSDAKEDMIHCAGIDGSQFAQRFQLVTDEAPLGYDKDGNIVVMSVDKLKPMQRVLLKGGYKGIVVRDDKDNVFLAIQKGMWNPAYFDATGYSEEFNIVEVYETTSLKGSPFDYDVRGALIWKKVDVVKEAAKKEADTALAAAKEALAKAEAARAALN